MDKDLILFQKDELSLKYKFYTLIDLLITNQSESRFESYLLLGIFYIQILSPFYSEQLGVFDAENAKSDSLLNYIYKIIRLKGLFKDNYNNFKK